MRVKRTTNGPEVRGCKPVTVYFEKWQDKDEVLRKNNLLRGSNIYISEDFSKRVRDQVNTLHQMFSPICFTNFFHKFFSVCAVEKERELLICQNRFFLSLPVEKEIMANTR